MKDPNAATAAQGYFRRFWARLKKKIRLKDATVDLTLAILTATVMHFAWGMKDWLHLIASGVIAYILFSIGHLMWKAITLLISRDKELEIAEQVKNQKEAALPALRPKIVALKFGRSPDNRYGLFIENHGEPAFDIHMDEPVMIGTAKLKFWDRTYSGLKKEQDPLFIDSEIELSSHSALTASALRDQMIKAEVETLAMAIRYRDLDNNKWITNFQVIREFWEHGLRIASIEQEQG